MMKLMIGIKRKKTCSICLLSKKIEFFDKGRARCKSCRSDYNKAYRKKHKKRINKRNSEYRIANRKIINLSRKKRRAKDPQFKMRECISRSIRWALKIGKRSKNGESCFQALGYSIDELMIHIESQFEPWMNWKNRGIYDPKTFDKKPTWQLDHIIPQSHLPFSSMKDLNFKICWGLDNLRPLSSKQNNLDGARRSK